MIAIDIISSNGLSCLPSFAYRNVIPVSERLGWMALCSVFKILLQCSLEGGLLLQTEFEPLLASSGDMGRVFSPLRLSPHLSGHFHGPEQWGTIWDITYVWKDFINCEVFFTIVIIISNSYLYGVLKNLFECYIWKRKLNVYYWFLKIR